METLGVASSIAGLVTLAEVIVVNRLGDDPQIVDRSRIESGISIGSVSIDNGSIQALIQGRCLVSN